MTSKRILLIQRRPPQDVCARESLDAALVAGVFDQSVSILFRDDGVAQLLATQADGTDDGLGDLIRSLADYGIEEIFACRDSIEARGLADSILLLPVTLLKPAEQTKLIAEADAVIND